MFVVLFRYLLATIALFSSGYFASNNSNLEHKIIRALRDTDCLAKFDYSGQLSASSNQDDCNTGGTPIPREKSYY